MASDQLTNLRGKDPGANRQTDAIARLVTPVCQAVMRTPIMGAPPPTWIIPDLMSGLTQYGNGYSPLRYHRDALGYVHVVGGLYSAAGAAPGSTVAVLPSGYRPKYHMTLIGEIGGAFGIFAMRSYGSIEIPFGIGAGLAMGFAFDFLAEQ